MLDGIFIFDNVIHIPDMSDANLRNERDAPHSRDQMRGALYPKYRLQGTPLPPWKANKRWNEEEVYKLVFEDAPTDMAMAQVVPIFDWFKDYFAPVMTHARMAQRYPDRVLFCGGVDPVYLGMQECLRQMEYQVKELGARSMKFYNAHIKGAWRCDDEEIAYPLYRQCQKLGIKVVQFHKGIPFGLQNMEQLAPNDLQKAARDFPDLNFIIHHVAHPYFEEAVSIGSRFPNVYIALSGTIAQYFFAPRRAQEVIGRLLQEVGSDKLLWGSEAALAGGPMPFLKAFMDLDIPEDLRSGYGFPQITRRDKELILGENFARMMSVDIPAKKRQLGLTAKQAH